MDFSYKEIKLGLIKYFVKIEKYKMIKSKEINDLIYFYSNENEYGLIVLAGENYTINLENEELLKILEKVKISNHHAVKILNIVIDNKQNQVTQNENLTVIKCGEGELKNNLKNFYARINLLSIKKNSDQPFFKKATNIDNEEAIKDLPTLDEMRDEFNKFQVNLRANRLTVTWLIIAAFAAVPLIFVLLTMNMGIQSLASLNPNLYSQLQTLLTGGTNFNLTIAGEQGWRVLTYGFATPSSNLITNLVIIGIAGYSLFNVSRLSENTAGPIKMFIAFILAYVLTGFFSSVMLPPSIVTGGLLPVLAILIGITIMSVAMEKTPKATFTRMKLIGPIIILIFVQLMFGNKMQFIAIGVGFASGALIEMIIKKNFKDLNWTHILAAIILLAIIIVPTVFVWVPRYGTPIDMNTLMALKVYLDKDLLNNVDIANNIIQKIGWDAQLRLGTNGVISIIIN
ncbi:hypothetical protein ESOMN_v1c02930 [Williamsoniiplasma somnilux]|uniref:Uncharacterized protein n=1 Tax=Williamsoniiplasma somnilux TaxID=215578 RepID=A0A2K8NXW4_9MOLU|nr:hypothetical protein [Williamsoniiplasma somnilux]ATZ18675.1 hypothetical protein ESOMN_v1c02930 [Williamsoniiplasma somnilux]